METMKKTTSDNGKTVRITGETEKSSVFITVDSLINLNGLTEDMLMAIGSSVLMAVQGYQRVKDLSFSEQNEIFRNSQPELKLLSNKKLREAIEAQIEFGKNCQEILTAIEEWKKSQNEKNDGAKIISF